MKLIILAAGYATRLYPLTLNQPKPLLPVAGKPMVDHVLVSLGAIDAIDEAFIDATPEAEAACDGGRGGTVRSGRAAADESPYASRVVRAESDGGG